MSSAVLDRTKQMMDLLGDEQLEAIQSVAKAFLKQKEEDSPFRPVTKAQILEDIQGSKEDFSANRAQDAKDAMREMRSEIGL